MITPPVEKTSVERSFEILKVPDKEQPDGFVMKIDLIKADRGDTIRWRANGKDGDTEHVLSIWSPKQGLFVTPLVAVMHKGPVEATILETAPDGVYEYCIYDHTEHKFVTYESHPKIEIPSGD
jgi:hypothetical protein